MTATRPCPVRSAPARPGARAAALPWLLAAGLAAVAALASRPASAQALPAPAAAQPAPPAAAPGQDPCAEGDRLYRAGDYDAASALLRDCLQRGESVPVLVRLAAVSALGRRPAEAKQYASRALAVDSTSVEARYWLGRALLAQGDAAGARAQWEKGLARSSRHPGILEGLARLAAERGESAKAYNLLNQLLQVGVTDSWVHRMMSDMAGRRGRWVEAFQQWREAIRIDGADGPSLLKASELAILAADTAAAVASCREAVKLDPSAPSYGGLGVALFASRRYQEALDALRRAVELDPGHASYRFHLANVLEVLDQTDEAETHFRAFVEMEPKDAMGHFNYAMHLDKQGRTVEALDQATAACRLSSRLMSARLLRGQLLEQLGRYPEATAEIDTLLARDAENRDKLTAWRSRVSEKEAAADSAQREGKVHLLYIVAGDTTAVRLIRRDLRQGIDFSVIATRYSVGPKAAQGGDIGLITPSDMVEPLRAAIARLGMDEVSPPIASKGLTHFFKRVR
jgi:tetratricopeptide (TPR) repeat protein